MKFIKICLFASLTLALSSCVSKRELVSFNEARLPDGVPTAIANASEIRVQADDLLRIAVHSVDPEAAAPFNVDPPEPPVGGTSPATLELFTGYLVDADGFIDFPLIGRLRVAGRTLENVKALVRQEVLKYIKDPVVSARFVNFKITLLGEVNTPGVVSVTNNRLTLLEAIGRAGDFTSYADRGTVLVIREEGGQRMFKRLDLHSAEIFDSPYFYLRQNDVIYVEPIDAVTATVADRGQRVVSYGSAIVSVVALIATLIISGN